VSERERERSFEFEIFGWSAERDVERGMYNLRFSWASFLTITNEVIGLLLFSLGLYIYIYIYIYISRLIGSLSSNGNLFSIYIFNENFKKCVLFFKKKIENRKYTKIINI
jgi:hypothetical protein